MEAERSRTGGRQLGDTYASYSRRNVLFIQIYNRMRKENKRRRAPRKSERQRVKRRTVLGGWRRERSKEENEEERELEREKIKKERRMVKTKLKR